MARRTLTAKPIEEGSRARVARRPSTVKVESRLRRDAGGERVAVYLPPEMAVELRVRCARERRSVSDAITEAVGNWLSERPR